MNNPLWCSARFLTAAIVLLMLLLQSGCGFKDIDKRLFVLSIGIDHSDNEEKPYKIILKLAVPSGSLKQSGTKYTYLTKESESLASAIRLLKTHVDKEIDFGHAKVIVLGEDILHHDTTDVIDFFLRRRDIQKVSWVAVGTPTAESVLKAEPSSEMAGSHALFNIFDQNGVESSYIISTYLFDFYRRMVESGIDAILPVLSSSEDKKKIVTNSSILLNKNKEPLKLTTQETKLYNMMANNVEKFDIMIRRNELLYTVSVDTAKSTYKIITTPNEKPVLKMDITMEGIIEESNQEMDPHKLSTYSKYASEEEKKRITAFLKKLQENGADPLGFGLRYKATRLHTNDIYEEWELLYPEISFDVNVKVSIMSTGIIE
ncbi:Ger(x)C family spore germination protein [Bacillus sp. Marseille-P3661]|uniref:Ger(x)C family spore germination protein n=1 Tax=Bacillus sp. Marseille-P3661 TaxID=1936234 RepID=UPI000C8432D8|nr:Ger(x)C family spore germination protein [Bacillus sp. Marseille-P3661]